MAPVTDPNVAGLKKRLYGQVAGAVQPDGNQPVPPFRFQGTPLLGPPGATSPTVPMVSPDFAPTAKLPSTAPPQLGPRSTTMGAPAGYGTPAPAPAAPEPVPSPSVTGGPVAKTGLEPPAPAATTSGDPNMRLVALLNQGMSREEAVAQLTQEGVAPGTFNVKKDGTIGYRSHGDPNGVATGYLARSKNANEGDWAYGRSGDLLNGEAANWRDPWGNARTDPRPGESAAPATTSADVLQPPPPTARQAVTGNVGTNSAYGTPGSGVPGVYDFDNAGNPIDAFGAPYTGPIQGGPAPSAGAGGQNDFQSQIRDQLMKRLTELGTPVNEESSGISQALSGARDEGTRAAQTERTELAERLYAEGSGGLDSNALTMNIKQSGEKQAGEMSSLRANLIMTEYARKQAGLERTLALAVQSGDAESARAAQKAIADLQAQLQREGFGLDAAKYEAYLNQQAALYGLNG